jgi:hypothetical protein
MKSDDRAFHVWAPDLDSWPQSWMGVPEDLEYGRKAAADGALRRGASDLGFW